MQDLKALFTTQSHPVPLWGSLLRKELCSRGHPWWLRSLGRDKMAETVACSEDQAAASSCVELSAGHLLFAPAS